MSASVVIAGAGEIGSRHLQAMGRADFDCTVYLFDPSDAAVSRALERLGPSTETSRIRVRVAHSIDELPGRVDLAIVATTSRSRASVVSALLAHGTVSAFLLEKILFESLDDYDRIGRSLEAAGARAWVNCPRRMYPIYRELKEIVGKERVRLSVQGGEWGLACNGIHFVDLMAFLTGAREWRYDTSLVDAATIPAKREGFREFGGTLRVSGPSGELVLHAETGSRCPPVVAVSSAACGAVIFETEWKARLARREAGWSWSEVPLEPQYQSALTHRVARAIIEQGSCELTPFAESARLHEPYLEAFVALFNAERATPGNRTCPIT